MTRFIQGVLVCALLTAYGGVAFANDKEDLERRVSEEAAGLPVKIEVKIGLAATTQRWGFVPIQVSLTSVDGAIADVVVSLRHPEGESPLVDFLPTSLEGDAPRTLRQTVPARVINDAPAFLVEARVKGHLVGLALVYPDPSYNRVVLVLDRRGAPPTDLSKLTTTRAGQGGTRHDAWVAATFKRAEELPATPLEYTGVTAVILGDLPYEGWSATQAHALAGWVARGGHLVISLGQKAGALRQSPLGQALGSALAALPADATPIAGDQVTLRGALAPFVLDGSDPEGNLHPPTFTRLVPGAQDVVISSDDATPPRPFVLRRDHGLGTVTLIAADLWAPPFVHKAHSLGLLQSLLKGSVRYRPRAQWIFPKLAEIRQPTQVGPAFALLIIFALIAGPGIYFLLRSRKRGALLWIAIPGLTIAFSAVVPLYRLALRDAESRLVGVRLIEARAGDTVGVETIDAMLFAGSTGEKRLELRGQDATAYAVVPPRRFLRGRGSGAPGLGSVLGSAGTDGVLRCPLPVALWGARYLSCERTHPVKASRGEVALGAKTKIAVHYEGYLALENPLLVIPGPDAVTVHHLPNTLTPGSSYEVEVDLRAGAIQNAMDAALSGGEVKSGLAAIVIDHLVSGPVAARAQHRRKAYLIGHTLEPAPLRVHKNVHTRAFATVLVVELPVRYRDSIPFGALRPQLETSTIAPIDSAVLLRRRVTTFKLPEESREQPLHTLKLRLRATRWATLRSSEPEALVHEGGVATWKSIDLRVAKRDQQSVMLELTIPEPQRLFGPDRTIRLRESYRRPIKGADDEYTVRVELNVGWGERPPAPSLRPDPNEDEPEPAPTPRGN